MVTRLDVLSVPFNLTLTSFMDGPLYFCPQIFVNCLLHLPFNDSYVEKVHSVKRQKRCYNYRQYIFSSFRETNKLRLVYWNNLETKPRARTKSHKNTFLSIIIRTVLIKMWCSHCLHHLTLLLFPYQFDHNSFKIESYNFQNFFLTNVLY